MYNPSVRCLSDDTVMAESFLCMYVQVDRLSRARRGRAETLESSSGGRVVLHAVGTQVPKYLQQCGPPAGIFQVPSILLTSTQVPQLPCSPCQQQRSKRCRTVHCAGSYASLMQDSAPLHAWAGRQDGGSSEGGHCATATKKPQKQKNHTWVQIVHWCQIRKVRNVVYVTFL